MFARLTAKAILVAIALGMAFFGIGLLGFALAHALIAYAGVAGAYALAGALLLVPALIWAAILAMLRPRKPEREAQASDLTRVMLGALAKETPWIAIVGAGLAGVANMFLNRHKNSR